MPGASQRPAGNGRQDQVAGVYGALLTGTFASQSGPGGDATTGNAARQPGNAEADEEDMGPDLRACFFTEDHSDSAFELLGYFKCPLSSTALMRLARAGWAPDASGLVAAAPLAGKFWWVRGSVARLYPGAGPGSADDVQTTHDLFTAIARGYPAIVMDGPFDNKDDGHYALDVAWESPGG